MLDGELPTERRFEAAPPGWPQADFSVELWLVNHVNQPVGALIAGCAADRAEPTWRLSYADDDVVFALYNAKGTPTFAHVKLPPESGGVMMRTWLPGTLSAAAISGWSTNGP